MKVKDLIEQLKGYEDFDIKSSICDIDKTKAGYAVLNYRKFKVSIGDIGHSDKVIVLDLEEYFDSN